MLISPQNVGCNCERGLAAIPFFLYQHLGAGYPKKDIFPLNCWLFLIKKRYIHIGIELANFIYAIEGAKGLNKPRSR